MGAKVSKVLPISHCDGGHLEIARADVVDDGVAEDVIQRVGGGDMAAAASDDESEFGLIIGPRRNLGQHDRVRPGRSPHS